MFFLYPPHFQMLRPTPLLLRPSILPPLENPELRSERLQTTKNVAMYLRRIYRFSCTNPNLAAIYVLKNPLMMTFRHI